MLHVLSKSFVYRFLIYYLRSCGWNCGWAYGMRFPSHNIFLSLCNKMVKDFSLFLFTIIPSTHHNTTTPPPRLVDEQANQALQYFNNWFSNPQYIGHIWTFPSPLSLPFIDIFAWMHKKPFKTKGKSKIEKINTSIKEREETPVF